MSIDMRTGKKTKDFGKKIKAHCKKCYKVFETEFNIHHLDKHKFCAVCWEVMNGRYEHPIRKICLDARRNTSSNRNNSERGVPATRHILND